MDADLDTLVTALYVKIDELLKAVPQLAPWRPPVGIAPKLSDAELVTLAVLQALLGSPPRPAGCDMPTATCGACSRICPANPATTSVCVGQQGSWVMPPGHRQRHRAVDRRRLAGRLHPGRMRPLAGDRQALGPGRVGRLRLVPQPFALVLGAAAAPGVHPARPARRLRLDGAKAVDREVLAELLAIEPELLAARPGQVLIADKNYYGREFEHLLAEWGVRLLRPARQGELQRASERLFKPLRQLIESVNATFKGQLDLEQHGGHTRARVWVRVLQRILALTAAIWHNHHTGQPTLRSLIAYGH